MSRIYSILHWADRPNADCACVGALGIASARATKQAANPQVFVRECTHTRERAAASAEGSVIKHDWKNGSVIDNCALSLADGTSFVLPINAADADVLSGVLRFSQRKSLSHTGATTTPLERLFTTFWPFCLPFCLPIIAPALTERIDSTITAGKELIIRFISARWPTHKFVRSRDKRLWNNMSSLIARDDIAGYSSW